MPTIDEIARLAQVSPATVSKVINNRSYVSAQTRERVQRVIAETGFVPSQRARWLSAQRTFILGLLIPYTSDQLFTDPHLLEIMRGIEAVANEHDYNLLLSTARARTEAISAFTRLLRSDVVDAAIVVETLDVQGAGPPLEPAKPWAVIGYAEGEGAPAIHADDYGGAYAAAAHLVGLGHRRIGVISSVPRPSALDERLRGISDALGAAGLLLDERLVAVGDFSFESGERAGLELLGRAGRPSAIFALNDRMALGVVRAAQSLGLRVPDDLSVVGFDDISLAGLFTPALTTVRQPGFRLGEAAAGLVFARLEGSSPGLPTVISTELVIRDTTGPAPAVERR